MSAIAPVRPVGADAMVVAFAVEEGAEVPCGAMAETRKLYTEPGERLETVIEVEVEAAWEKDDQVPEEESLYSIR